MNSWLFLRGLAREAAHWGEFLSDFRQALPDAEIHCLDYPGVGQRYQEAAPKTVAGMADAVRAEFLKIPTAHRPQYLLANSLGGMVATNWVTRWPEDFNGLVLVNTSLAGLSSTFERLKPSAIPSVLKFMLWPEAVGREERVLSLVSNRPEIRARTAQEWGAIAKRHPIHLGTFVRQLRAGSSFTLPSTLPELPTLVVTCAQDRMVDSSCSMAIQRLWGAELAVHPTAGHDLALDDGPWLARMVAEWWQKRFA